eukprot:2800276-Amphidinium_carterae.1
MICSHIFLIADGTSLCMSCPTSKFRNGQSLLHIHHNSTSTTSTQTQQTCRPLCIAHAMNCNDDNRLGNPLPLEQQTTMRNAATTTPMTTTRPTPIIRGQQY